MHSIQIQRFKHPETWATVFLGLTLFLITLWRFGANQCLMLFVLLVFCVPAWRQTLFSKAYLLQARFLALYAFLIWALITVSYSEAGTVAHALNGFKGYAKLLLFLFIPLAITQNKSRYWIEQSLIVGVLLNVILSTLYFLKLFTTYLAPHISMNATFAINPLQLIFVVIIALWILARRLFEQRFAWHDITIFVLLMGYLWFVNIERSGFLLFMVLALVLAWQYGRKKWLCLALLVLPLFFMALYLGVPSIKMRVNLGWHNIQAFTQVKNVTQIGSDNSLGLRLAFAEESVQEIKLHPFLGAGLGSFKNVYDQKYNLNTQEMHVQDPHNAYTLAAFELGIPGLCLYLFCLYRLFPKSSSAQGIWWAFFVMGFVDSGFILNAVAFSFIILTGVIESTKSGVVELH
jgi:O-antigen ligase